MEGEICSKCKKITFNCIEVKNKVVCIDCYLKKHDKIKGGKEIVRRRDKENS
jgi:hypothetical protein